MIELKSDEDIKNLKGKLIYEVNYDSNVYVNNFYVYNYDLENSRLEVLEEDDVSSIPIYIYVYSTNSSLFLDEKEAIDAALSLIDTKESELESNRRILIKRKNKLFN